MTRQRRCIYELTLWEDYECVYRSIEFCTPSQATLYRLKGYTVENVYRTLSVGEYTH